MNVRELCRSLGLNPVAGEKGLDRKVDGAYAGDLLSFVMANASKGNVWITIQAHSNIVAVACLVEMACIIVAAGVQVDGDTLEKADKEGIPILAADLDVYTLCCKLHSLGIQQPMNLTLDLHIHSALSPCGDNDMTPNNIVNMALLKGLDAIAVTDHNSAENVEAVMKLGFEKGIVVVPGMEVQSKEEVHLLCYFSDLDRALGFQQRVYDNLEGENNPDYFGDQLIMDEMDRVVGHNRRLLIGSTNLSVERIVDLVVREGGRVVPAHVDKKAYSIISNLGFIPPDLDIKSVEVSRPGNIAGLLQQYGQLKGYGIIHSSDAHRLGDILEREFFMEVEEKSIRGILAQL